MPSLSRSTSVQSTAVLSFQLVSNCVPLQPSIVRELRDGVNYASTYGIFNVMFIPSHFVAPYLCSPNDDKSVSFSYQSPFPNKSYELPECYLSSQLCIGPHYNKRYSHVLGF